MVIALLMASLLGAGSSAHELMRGPVCEAPSPRTPGSAPAVEQERLAGVARRPNTFHVLIWPGEGPLAVEVVAAPLVREVTAVNAPSLRRGPLLTIDERDWHWVGAEPLVLRFEVHTTSVGEMHVARLQLREATGRLFEHTLALDMFDDADHAELYTAPEVTARVEALEARGESWVAEPPLAELRACLVNRPYRMALDPGHNPKGDRGARSASGGWEVSFNERLVTSLMQELAKTQGLELARTRAPQESLSLEQRVRRVRELQPDLVLSIHHDSIKPEHLQPDRAGGRRATCPEREGFSLYVPTSGPHGVPAYQLARHLSRAWMESGRPLGRFFASGEPQFGIYRGDSLTLIGRSTTPTVLAEVGYVCHPQEEAWLRDPRRVRQQAKTMARAVRQHLWLHHCRGMQLTSPWIPDGGAAMAQGS